MVEKQRKWVNQYVSLVREKKDLILVSRRGDIPPEIRGQMDSARASFPRCIVELGSGSGGHLLGRAEQSPDALCVGYELRFKRIYRTVEKGEQKGLKNILCVQGDAASLPQFFPPQSLDGIYINFPDPWDKPRWRKHRLLSAEFFLSIHPLLKPGTFFSFKTDHEEYFDKVTKVLEGLPSFVRTKYSRDLHKSEYLDNNIMSEFETLFTSQGLPVYFLEVTPAPIV